MLGRADARNHACASVNNCADAPDLRAARPIPSSFSTVGAGCAGQSLALTLASLEYGGDQPGHKKILNVS
jgi:hypothetical protein